MPLLLLRRRQFPSWLQIEALADDPLEKSGTPPGCKWITVHPDGKDEPGRPVLIKESSTPGTYHIIGGAGGKLNHMKITHLDPEKWAQTKKDNAAKRKQQMAEAKARGDVLPEDEEQYSEARKKNQRAFVDAVASKLGWGKWHKDAADFQREGLTPGAAKLAAHRHLQSFVTRAKQEVGDAREQQRRSHEARDAAGLGNLALDTNPYRATDAEINPQHLLEQVATFQAQAQHFDAEAHARAGDESAGLAGLADRIDQEGGQEDFDPHGLPLPNLPEARAVIAELQAGHTDAPTAAAALRGLAGAVGSGDLQLPEGDKAAAALGAASLFQQAHEAVQNGDEDAAKRLVEGAKKAAGERGVTALDIIGKKQSEGSGYKPINRQKARADIEASGSTAPAELVQRVKETNDRLKQAQKDGEGPGVIDAIQLQREAYQRAHAAATDGDHAKAADYIIQAEKYLVQEAQHGNRSAKGQALVLAATAKIKRNNAEVQEAKAEGRVGAAGLDPDVRDMADVKGLIVAAAKFAEREQELQRAKKGILADTEHFRQVVADDDRVRMDERDPEKEDQMVRDEMRKIEEMAGTKAAADLHDALDDPTFFSSYAGDQQVGQAALDKFVGMGAHAMTNLLGQIVGGSEFLDRPTLDQLGPKAAARFLADYLANTRDPREVQAILGGLSDYHTGRAADVATGAMTAAQECLDRARDFEIRGAKNSYDLSEMEKYNGLRLQAVNQAMASLGSAYGELNMCAELIWSLGNARAQSDHSVEIDGGKKDVEGLVTLGHALGLRPDEHTIVPPKVNRETKTVTPGRLVLNGDGVRKIVKERPAKGKAKALRLAAIKKGDRDEAGYLPKGIARRPADTWSDPELKQDRYRFEPEWKNMNWDNDSSHKALRAYVAEGIAQGKPALQTFNDTLHHADMVDADGAAHPRWERAVHRAFGVNGTDFGSDFAQEVEARGDQLAAWHHLEHTEGDASLHGQRLDSDASVVEAAHRTLAQHPYGVLAHKDVGDLDTNDRQHLRDYFYKGVLGEPTPEEQVKGSAADDAGDGPRPSPYATNKRFKVGQRVELPRMHVSMGKDGTLTNDPNHPDARKSADYGIVRRVNRDGTYGVSHHMHTDDTDDTKRAARNVYTTTHADLGGANPGYEEPLLRDTSGNVIDTSSGGVKWDRFVGQMGGNGRPGPEAAYRAMLEHVRGETHRLFAQNYGQVSGKSLKTATGRYSDQGKVQAALGAKAGAPTTIGTRAEGHLKAMWKPIADSFTPGKPVKMMAGLSMDGRYVNQQRSVKAIRDQKRIAMFLGVGSGKTLVSTAGFTDAHLDGEARKSLFAVPNNMVGQFGAEAATYIDPASGITWHAKVGQNAADRASALAGDHHMHVTTHHSLRDDTVKALADSDFKGDVKAAEKYLMTAPRELRKRAVKRAFDHRGWSDRLDYFAMDEGHEALNRKGKEDSLLARVMDGISDNSKHYVPMTGTPCKNDPSEVWDWKQKIDPENHPDEAREDFLRSYDGLIQQAPRIDVARRGQKDLGPNDPKDWSNVALAEAVQRDVSPYFFATRVPLKSRLRERNISVTLSPEHQKLYDAVSEDASKANHAKANGTVDADALERLSPNTFKDKHLVSDEAFGKRLDGLNSTIGTLREEAYNRVLHGQDQHNSKLDALSKLMHEYRGQTNKFGGKGKAGIVFASNLAAVHQIKARLERDGHRVVAITGEDSSADKEKKKLAFQPGDYKQHGDKHAKADIVVCSDAVSAGADLPRGEFVTHYDIPNTSKTHEQRTARAHRLSNESDVEMANIVSRTPHEMVKWMRLKNKYALSDVFQNPAENMDDSGLQRHINNHRTRIALGRMARRVGRSRVA